MIEIGHNSEGEVIKGFLDRINNLENEKRDLAEDIRSVYGEAKEKELDVKELRAAVKRMREDEAKRAKRAEFDAAVDAMLAKAGIMT